jgi:hypothetical protein
MMHGQQNNNRDRLLLNTQKVTAVHQLRFSNHGWVAACLFAKLKKKTTKQP